MPASCWSCASSARGRSSLTVSHARQVLCWSSSSHRSAMAGTVLLTSGPACGHRTPDDGQLRRVVTGGWSFGPRGCGGEAAGVHETAPGRDDGHRVPPVGVGGLEFPVRAFPADLPGVFGRRHVPVASEGCLCPGGPRDASRSEQCPATALRSPHHRSVEAVSGTSPGTDAQPRHHPSPAATAMARLPGRGVSVQFRSPWSVVGQPPRGRPVTPAPDDGTTTAGPSTEEAISCGMAAGDNTAVLRALATSIALLPRIPVAEGEERPDDAIALPVIEQEGQRYIPVFTPRNHCGRPASTPRRRYASRWPSWPRTGRPTTS